MNGKRPGGWVALAYRYFTDPKILAVSEAAELMWVHGLCLTGAQDGDGMVPDCSLQALRPKGNPRKTRQLARELVAAGLWVEVPGGYSVPPDTWSRWQETAEQRRSARARENDRKAKWRRRSPTGTPHGTPRGSPDASVAGAGAGGLTAPPDPPCPPRWNDDQMTIDESGYLFVGPAGDGHQ